MKEKVGQWTIEASEEAFKISNIAEDGSLQYYQVVSGKYGQPLIEVEPSLAFEPPTNFRYVNIHGDETTPDQKIGGFICYEGMRASLTNALSQGIAVSTNDDGSIQVGYEKWWLASLLQKDRNRFIGYDAYLVRNRRNVIYVVEMEDLDLFF